MRKQNGKLVMLALGAATVMSTAVANAQTSATTIMTNASTAVNTVEGIVAGAVGFFVVIKIVQWIRK